ncbi:carboxymuconolactone decarboxylase family protein [Marinobacter sp. JSM 1782161]|uniref:carboxymuconolactone decarboxylase family protein n=1 Tax=Marinobacter sp. JSM 1782161 TaxID=2685906 RepID=UPI001403DBD6|nr:carboxymuconolactone decarboxylase family protein [Marinobacter sp. JSM 1782161]
MKNMLAVLPMSLLLLAGPSWAEEPEAGPFMELPQRVPTPDEVSAVSPALAAYTRNLLLDEVWEREGLSQRDRSLVTIAALIARNQVIELPYHINRALDNGVKPAEVSETITHLAFYSGWPNANTAVGVAYRIFEDRGITADQLPSASPELLPLDKEAEAKRREYVDNLYGDVSPGVVHYTTEALFLDLWLRPGLSPRNRSLVTVSALVAAGKVEQVPFHLNRAMDNGLTQDEASEVLTQLAYYAGWPNVFSALPVFKKVFAER